MSTNPTFLTLAGRLNPARLRSERIAAIAERVLAASERTRSPRRAGALALVASNLFEAARKEHSQEWLAAEVARKQAEREAAR